MTNTTTTLSLALVPNLKMAWQDVHSSFERFCLTAGIGAIEKGDDGHKAKSDSPKSRPKKSCQPNTSCTSQLIFRKLSAFACLTLVTLL